MMSFLLAVLLTTRFKVRAGAAGALLVLGCTTPTDGASCPRREAAFRLELTAPGTAVPPDTTIQVAYQGSETETFSLMPSNRQNEDVCCRLGVPTSGVLPHVACPKNPPPGVPTDASATREAGVAPANSGVPDASGVRDGAATLLTEGGPLANDASSAAPNAPNRLTALFCELLTNGPATIHVTASGYPALDQELQSKLREDGCGVRTVDVHASLIGPDGGP
jgi:hypothetical protein